MAIVDRRPGVRPRPTLGHRLDVAARASFPTCITVLLMLVIVAPLGIDGQPVMLPAVAVGGVWFWSLAEPEYLPPPIVFLVGLLLDLLGYLPPGVGVLTLLSVHACALVSRGFVARHGFALAWCCFALVAATASVLIWLLVMLLNLRFFSVEPAIFQSGVTFAVYPLLAVPFAAAQRLIRDPGRA